MDMRSRKKLWNIPRSKIMWSNKRLDEGILGVSSIQSRNS